MSEIKPYRVNDDGMTCREVNPHKQLLELTYAQKHAFNDSPINMEYYDFEASVINYPLTVEQKPGELIDGVIINQFQTPMMRIWHTLNDDAVESFKKQVGGQKYRLAVEPVAPSKEKPLEYFDDFDPKYKELHKAIDDIVTKVGYKDFAMAVLKYQVHNLSQYQLMKSWR